MEKSLPAKVYEKKNYQTLILQKIFFRASDIGYEYLCEKRKDATYKLTIVVNETSFKRSLCPSIILKLKDIQNYSYEEFVTKNIIYNCIDYILQNLQLSKKQSFIHASSFDINGKGLTLLSWGGIGKTNLLLKILNEKKGRFVSDDLGIIDENGNIFFKSKEDANKPI